MIEFIPSKVCAIERVKYLYLSTTYDIGSTIYGVIYCICETYE